MNNTSSGLKQQKIRKPFGLLTQPSHIPIAIAEAIQQAEAGAATCGHCQNILQTLTNLQSFADSLVNQKLPPISGKDFFSEID